MNVDTGLVTLLSGASEAAEAYRIIRTNLRFGRTDKPLRTMLVTSTGRGEGKSLNMANLSVVLAQDGARVLAVDADLRQPALGKLFGLEPTAVGLSTLLQGMHSMAEAMKAGPLERLTVLPSGPVPENPAELLGSDRMAEFLTSARAAFDYVLLDTPPSLGVSDAILLAPQVDGVLLVVRSGVTAYPRAQQARDALLGVNASIVGVMLSSVGRGDDGLTA